MVLPHELLHIVKEQLLQKALFFIESNNLVDQFKKTLTKDDLLYLETEQDF